MKNSECGCGRAETKANVRTGDKSADGFLKILAAEEELSIVAACFPGRRNVVAPKKRQGSSVAERGTHKP